MCLIQGTGTLTIDGDDMLLEGITFTNGSSSQSLDLSAATDLNILGCYFYGAGESIRGANSHRARIIDCRFTSEGTIVIEVAGDDWLIQGCYYTGVTATYFVQDTDTYSGLILSNCQIGPAFIDLSDHDNWTIRGCGLGGSVLADGGTQGAITGCWVYDPAPALFNTAFIEIDNMDALTITGNVFRNLGSGNGIELDTCTNITISGNTLNYGCGGSMILLTACDKATVTGNTIEWPDQHGIHLDGTSEAVVTGNTIFGSGQGTTNTYDQIYIDGNRNLVQANKLRPATTSPLTRYGVNVASGECNMVWGNDLGDPDDYGTDALADAGANTQLFYPNDAIYGDNLTDCGTGS